VTAQDGLPGEKGRHYTLMLSCPLPNHTIPAHRVTDILPHQAMVNSTIAGLDREIGPMSHDDHTLFGRSFVVFGHGELRARVKTAAAAILDCPNAFDLALGEPPPPHDQGLKW
jgi:hypothetical protein